MNQDKSFIDVLMTLVDNVDRIPELTNDTKEILDLVKDANKISDVAQNVSKILDLVKDANQIPDVVAYVTTLDTVSKTIQEQVSSLPSMQEKIDSIIRTQESEASSLLDSFGAKLEQQKKDIVQSFGDISEIRSELEKTKAELEITKKNLNEKESCIEKKGEEIEDLRTKLSLKDDEIVKAKTEIEELKPQKVELDQWKKVVNRYRELHSVMISCDSAKAFLVQRGVEERRAESVFRLIVGIGCTADFAKAFHDFMKTWKQNNAQPMNHNEQEVYAAINQCYREACGKDMDVFILPGGSSVMEAFEKTPFDKSTMEDLTDPRRTSLKYAQEIYVPALRSLTSSSGGILGKSQVKAGNN